jgi:hypothetical protein
MMVHICNPSCVGGMKQDDQEFEASFKYIARLCLKNRGWEGKEWGL